MLKRHPALQDLSRDHHLFLQQAQQIRYVVEAHDRAMPLPDLIESLLHFWETHGERHITEEEDVLFPLVRKHAPDAADEFRKLEIDHHWLRDKFTELADLPRLENSTPLLRSLGEYIERHVRYEERTVFMHIQEALDDDVLATFARQSADFRKQHRPPGSVGPAQAENNNSNDS